MRGTLSFHHPARAHFKTSGRRERGMQVVPGSGARVPSSEVRAQTDPFLVPHPPLPLTVYCLLATALRFPLEAEIVTVRIGDIELLHAVPGHFGWITGNSPGPKKCVGGINVGAAEIQAG